MVANVCVAAYFDAFLCFYSLMETVAVAASFHDTSVCSSTIFTFVVVDDVFLVAHE